MSEQSRIELVDSKISAAAINAMEKYREFKTMMGNLDFDMYNNWLKYSNVLIQVCADTQMCGMPGAAAENRPDIDTQQREQLRSNRQEWEATRQAANRWPNPSNPSICCS